MKEIINDLHRLQCQYVNVQGLLKFTLALTITF